MDLYKIIGVMLLLTFYGSYFTKMLLQSKQGIKTNRMGKGNKPSRTLFIERVLQPLTLLTALVQLVSVILNDTLPFIINNNSVRYIGLLISSLGVMIFIISMRTMRDSWRAGVDKSQNTELVIDGIYKYSRNPAFVGFDLLYIGLALSFSNYINILFACSAILLFHFQILEEEKFLINKFKDEYLNYKRKTLRYFGKR